MPKVKGRSGTQAVMQNQHPLSTKQCFKF